MIVTACRPSQVRRHEHRVRSSAVLSRLRTIDRSARRSNEVMPHRNRAVSVLAAVAAPAGTTISIVVVTALVCLAGLGALGAQAGGALNLPTARALFRRLLQVLVGPSESASSGRLYSLTVPDVPARCG